MIESTTGQIRLALDGVHVNRTLTRETFLAAPCAGQSRQLVRNEPYCSFALPTVPYDGHQWAWSLWFRGSVLQRVSIACADSEFDSPWSEECELARKRVHDSVLLNVLGRRRDQYRFPWGVIDSLYDLKSGCSTIEVTYGV